MKKLINIFIMLTFVSNITLAVCTANVDMGTNFIQNLASPSTALDATNKAYVDNIQTSLETNINTNTSKINDINSSVVLNTTKISDLNSSINNINQSKWSNDNTNSLIKPTNLSDGSTPRDINGNNTFVIKDNGQVGIGTNTPIVSLQIKNTDAVIVPVGSTAQRPAAPVVGMIRFNTSTSAMEGYTGSAWVDLSN